MPVQKLTTIKDSNPVLYEKMTECRKLIAGTGHAAYAQHMENHTAAILELLTSPHNSRGKFYKYYFDTVSEDENNDPAGNHLLLLAVSRGCFNKTDRDSVAVPLTDIILANAENKLGKDTAEFKEFLSFKCVVPLQNSWNNRPAYYFDNSALTLAIKSGMIATAEKLVILGADVNATSYSYIDHNQIAHGCYTPLHLELMRLPLSSHQAEEILLIRTLLSKGAKPEPEDNFHRTAKDIVNLHNLHAGDKKIFSFKLQAEAEQCVLGQRDSQGKIPAYSFNELIRNEQFRNLYNSKVQMPLTGGEEEKILVDFITHSKLFLNSARNTPDTSKFCATDRQQLSYDTDMEQTCKVFNMLDSSEPEDINFSYPHDAFHGSPAHLEVCGLLGAEPCRGEEACFSVV